MRDTPSRTLRKGTLIAGDFQIPYATAGASVLICVNGMQQTMAMWRSVVKRMGAHGETDPIVDWVSTPHTAARFRSASFEIVPAGHFLHFERPEIVDTYATFLTSAT